MRCPLLPVLALLVTVPWSASAGDAVSSHTTAAPPEGALRITVDNTLLGLWINGEPVPTDPDRAGDWTRPETIPFQVQPGVNVVAVHARDAGVIAGLLAELQVGTTTLVSGGSWRVVPEAPDGWWYRTYDDTAWPRASAYGAWPGGIWGSRVQGWEGVSPDAQWIWTDRNEQHGLIDEEACFRFSFDAQLAWSIEPAGIPPAVRGDLDGDLRTDVVRVRSAGARTMLEITWGRGGHEVIGPVTMIEDGRVVETVEDFSWLLHWRAYPNTGGGYDVPILLNSVRFDRPDARGDALHCSSSDVATLLYLTPDGWILEHLGY